MPWVSQPIMNLTNNIPEPARTILSILLAVVIVMDVISTNRSLIKLNAALRDYQKFIEHHTSHIINFIRRGKRAFEMRFDHNKKRGRAILTYQQRRIIWAFPQLQWWKTTASLEKIAKNDII